MTWGSSGGACVVVGGVPVVVVVDLGVTVVAGVVGAVVVVVVDVVGAVVVVVVGDCVVVGNAVAGCVVFVATGAPVGGDVCVDDAGVLGAVDRTSFVGSGVGGAEALECELFLSFFPTSSTDEVFVSVRSSLCAVEVWPKFSGEGAVGGQAEVGDEICCVSAGAVVRERLLWSDTGVVSITDSSSLASCSSSSCSSLSSSSSSSF